MTNDEKVRQYDDSATLLGALGIEGEDLSAKVRSLVRHFARFATLLKKADESLRLSTELLGIEAEKLSQTVP